MTVPCRGQRRAWIILTAKALELIDAAGTRDSKGPLHLGVVRLQISIGNRPIDERCTRQVAHDRAKFKIALRKAWQPALPVHRTTADHLRNWTEKVDFGFFVCRGPEGTRIKNWIGPKVIAIHIRQLVSAEAFTLTPRPALKPHHLHSALCEHLRGSCPRCSRPDDNYIHTIRFTLLSHNPFLPPNRSVAQRRMAGS
jgi:hypothetical protein